MRQRPTPIQRDLNYRGRSAEPAGRHFALGAVVECMGFGNLAVLVRSRPPCIASSWLGHSLAVGPRERIVETGAAFGSLERDYDLAEMVC